MDVSYDHEALVGKAEISHTNRTMQEFFELAILIRRRLSKQGYLLDNYLSCVLDAVNSKD